MCEYISWIEFEKRIYFLSDKETVSKRMKEFQRENEGWKEDLKGHGAIRFFFPELGSAGKDCECTDFSSPDNFPAEIASAIRGGRMSKFNSRPDGLLNKRAQAKYVKIQQPARAEYEKIRQAAWAEYEKIEQPAWAEYEKIQQQALAEYVKVCDRTFWGLFWDNKNRAKAWKSQ